MRRVVPPTMLDVHHEARCTSDHAGYGTVMMRMVYTGVWENGTPFLLTLPYHRGYPKGCTSGYPIVHPFSPNVRSNSAQTLRYSFTPLRTGRKRMSPTHGKSPI